MANVQNNMQQEVAKLLIDTLNLEITVAEIDADAVLFGNEGLGLDSIDALELAFAISKRYGIQIKSGDDENIKIFSSLSSLAEYIAANKKIDSKIHDSMD